MDTCLNFFIVLKIHSVSLYCCHPHLPQKIPEFFFHSCTCGRPRGKTRQALRSKNHRRGNRSFGRSVWLSEWVRNFAKNIHPRLPVVRNFLLIEFHLLCAERYQGGWPATVDPQPRSYYTKGTAAGVFWPGLPPKLTRALFSPWSTACASTWNFNPLSSCLKQGTIVNSSCITQ